MGKTSVITARLDTDTVAELDRLAAYCDRSRAWLISKAIEQYVKQEIEFMEFIQEGEDAIDRGEFLTQEQMEEWAANLHRVDKAA
jgi:predicted transcriptional regulator